jgi:hypothetical protein
LPEQNKAGSHHIAIRLVLQMVRGLKGLVLNFDSKERRVIINITCANSTVITNNINLLHCLLNCNGLDKAHLLNKALVPRVALLNNGGTFRKLIGYF